jgi:hypothetical protein
VYILLVFHQCYQGSIFFYNSGKHNLRFYDLKYSFYIGFKDTNKPAGKKIRAKKNGAFITVSNY